MTKRKSRQAFTLLEILLVVAIIAILAGIVIVAINPGKQLADTRNSQRRTDLNTILDASYQYTIDSNGNMPVAIPTSATCPSPSTNEICRSGAASCTGLVDLSELTANQKYVVSLPVDPSSASTNGTGYFIAKNTNGRLTVCAPSAEQGVTLNITR